MIFSKNYTRLAAVSIVEAIMAMLILLIAFGMSFKLYLNILKTEQIGLKSQAKALAKQQENLSLNIMHFSSKIIDRPPFKLTQKLEPFFSKEQALKTDGLFILYSKVYDEHNILIYEKKSIHYIPNYIH